MQQTKRMRETFGKPAQIMLLVLIGMLTIAAVSFGRTPSLQTGSQPVSLFKVSYGEKPTQLRMRFPGSRLIYKDENGDELREPLPGGGPTTFCACCAIRRVRIAISRLTMPAPTATLNSPA